MKKIAFMIGLAVVALGVSPALAQQSGDMKVSQVSYERFAELEAEVASLRAGLHNDAAMIYGDGGSAGCSSCGNAGCNSYGSGCSDCCYGGSGVYFGADYISVMPHVEGDVAYSLFQGGGVIDRSFTWDDVDTVRFFLGYNNDNGYGGRLRYWQFDDSANPEAIAVAGGQVALAQVNNFAPYTATGQLIANPGQILVAEYDLNLDVLDMEVTKQLRYRDTTFMFASGLRYAELEQQYRVSGGATPTPPGAAPTFTAALNHKHGIDAIGPTLSAEIWHPVRPCSRLSVYAAGRVSVLFGQQSQVWETIAGGAVNGSYSRINDDDVLPVTEISVGSQYDFDSGLFIRGGWEGQIWHGAGGPNSITGDLAFEGFSFSAGFVR